MKKLFAYLLALAALAAASTPAFAAETAPKSVIHVVTIAWKPDATPEQIKAALDGAQALPAAYPSITRVWTRALKVQNPTGTKVLRTHAIVMEFANEKALADYTDSDAQKAWYKLYQPVRQESTTHDITN
jgi:uncharacterized protein (DUF1330 family)